MQIKITVRQQKTFSVPFQFPICRLLTVNEDERVYWRFESRHKVTRIHDKISEMSILVYEDERADFISEMITSEDMLFGGGNYAVTSEKVFDKALQRLINLVCKG